MTNSVMIRCEKLDKKNGIWLTASLHNKRLLKEPTSNIDKSKSHLNYALRGPKTPKEIDSNVKKSGIKTTSSQEKTGF